MHERFRFPVGQGGFAGERIANPVVEVLFIVKFKLNAVK